MTGGDTATLRREDGRLRGGVVNFRGAADEAIHDISQQRLYHRHSR